MDINALRDRLSQLNRKTSKGNDIWKPKDEHQVRLVQNPHKSEPLEELYFHNEIGESFPIFCLRMNSGKECPICDFADRLKSFKDEKGAQKPEKLQKADFEIFKKIQAKARVYAPMVERGHEEEGAKWWGMTPAQAQSALEICLDGDRLEEMGIAKDDGEGASRILFDPKKGYDLGVSYAKPGEKGNAKTFTTITIKGRIKPSALAKDDEATKKILESVKKISEVFPEPTLQEVQRAFNKFVGNAGSESPTTGGDPKYVKESKPTNTKENAKVSGTRSLDDAFGDMLADES